MLSSINFLFLISLGFLSWIILCYIHQIQQFVHFNTNKPQGNAKQEVPVMAEAVEPIAPVKPKTENNGNYDVYVNSVCIFVCIYALVKITHLAEMYLARSIGHNINLPQISQSTEQTCSISKALENQENLKLKINKLENENIAMKQKLCGAQSQTSIDLEETVRNVYISNKHIHLNPKIYINNANTANTQNEIAHQPDIWEKYMEVKNSRSMLNMAELSPHIPVVMSKEDLENIKGIF